MGTKNGGIELTVKEQAEHEEAQATAQKVNRDDKIAQEAIDAQKAIDKAPGLAKLIELGLSEAEIDALTG
jgi:hypothetical protein